MKTLFVFELGGITFVENLLDCIGKSVFKIYLMNKKLLSLHMNHLMVAVYIFYPVIRLEITENKQRTENHKSEGLQVASTLPSKQVRASFSNGNTRHRCKIYIQS